VELLGLPGGLAGARGTRPQTGANKKNPKTS
jgi:hypothetical protein